MKKLLFFMIFSMGLGLSSCKEESPDPGYLAGIAAKGYYDLLLEGKYEEYVAGFNQPYRIPKGYHEQLVLNAEMYVEQQQKEHAGMKKIDMPRLIPPAMWLMSSCRWLTETVPRNRSWFRW